MIMKVAVYRFRRMFAPIAAVSSAVETSASLPGVMTFLVTMPPVIPQTIEMVRLHGYGLEDNEHGCLTYHRQPEGGREEPGKGSDDSPLCGHEYLLYHVASPYLYCGSE